LCRLRFSSVHPGRGGTRSDVHPVPYAGQSVGVSADARYLDIQCPAMGLPQSGHSPLSSVAIDGAPINAVRRGKRRQRRRSARCPRELEETGQRT
jgi:hypothetical protein